jgi:hypothetical protein
LTTSAVSYGALSDLQGKVAMRWDIAPHNVGFRLICRWTERNRSPDVPPAIKRFDLSLIARRLRRELYEGRIRGHL